MTTSGVDPWCWIAQDGNRGADTRNRHNGNGLRQPRPGAALDRSGLSAIDRNFVTEMVYGTLRRRRSCDYLVDRFLTSDPPPEARSALRVGAYQLHFAQTPPHAAVSSTVGAVSKRFRGFVNAVLRKVSTSEVNWPDRGTELSYPDWLIERLVADLGESGPRSPLSLP